MLSRLSASLAHRGLDGEHFWIQGAAGLACQLLRVTPESSTESQPVVHASGPALVFDGRLDNRDELLAALHNSPEACAASPDPVLVLAAYAAFGERFAEKLAGDFALGLLDPNRRQLLLARDALGIRPLYYCRWGDAFLFASEIKALLAHPEAQNRPNDDFLAELLLSCAEDNRGATCFHRVFSLLPAHVALLTPERFVTRRYWDFDTTRRTRFGSFPEYAEAFRELFRRAVRRRLRSAYPVSVSVSGGLDSSSIFCLAENFRRRTPSLFPALHGISYTTTDGSFADESAYVTEIERTYGIVVERLPAVPAGILQGSAEAVRAAEAPFLDVQWDTTQLFLATARARGARLVLTGHWGDELLFDQAYLVDLFRHLRWFEIRTHLREYARWYTEEGPGLSNFFVKTFLRDIVRYNIPDWLLPVAREVRAGLMPSPRERAWYAAWFRRRARRSASRWPVIRGPFATAHAKSLYREVRSRYHVDCMEWNNKVAARHGLEKAFPFLDRDLLGFLMTIPGEVQTWKGVPRALLRKAMRDVLPTMIVERRWKADFTHVVNAGMERDFPCLASRLGTGGLAARRGYVLRSALGAELARVERQIRGPNCSAAWSLADLWGLETWLQTFFGAERERETEPAVMEASHPALVS